MHCRDCLSRMSTTCGRDTSQPAKRTTQRQQINLTDKNIFRKSTTLCGIKNLTVHCIGVDINSSLNNIEYKTSSAKSINRDQTRNERHSLIKALNLHSPKARNLQPNKDKHYLTCKLPRFLTNDLTLPSIPSLTSRSRTQNAFDFKSSDSVPVLVELYMMFYQVSLFYR